MNLHRVSAKFPPPAMRPFRKKVLGGDDQGIDFLLFGGVVEMARDS